MSEYMDDRNTVGQPWVIIPRSSVTISIGRELLGVMADVALKLIKDPSVDPFDDAEAAMLAAWAPPTSVIKRSCGSETPATTTSASGTDLSERALLEQGEDEEQAY
jgi:hypothetical protein